jgi:hypothetical protein
VIRFFKRLWLESRIERLEAQRGTAKARHYFDSHTDKWLEDEYARIDVELAKVRKELESL